MVRVFWEYLLSDDVCIFLRSVHPSFHRCDIGFVKEGRVWDPVVIAAVQARDAGVKRCDTDRSRALWVGRFGRPREGKGWSVQVGIAPGRSRK